MMKDGIMFHLYFIKKKGINMFKTLEKIAHIYLIICVLIWLVQCISI